MTCASDGEWSEPSLQCVPRGCPRLCNAEETAANPYDCPAMPLLPFGVTATCREGFAHGVTVQLSGTGIQMDGSTSAALDGQTGVLDIEHPRLGWRVVLDTGNVVHVPAARLQLVYSEAPFDSGVRRPPQHGTVQS